MRGLETLGHSLDLRPIRLRTGFHTLDRWLYNAGVAFRPPRGVDLVHGVDLDGFLWARHRSLPFVVSLKGVIADELKNESGLTRALLSIQARWERVNARRADVVIAPSRYSADVARREYGLAAEKIAVVPEPIELERWTSLFAAAAPRPRGGPTILCVARMYPRKRIGDLPPNYCTWALRNLEKITPEERQGLQAVIRRKQAETHQTVRRHQ